MIRSCGVVPFQQSLIFSYRFKPNAFKCISLTYTYTHTQTPGGGQRLGQSADARHTEQPSFLAEHSHLNGNKAQYILQTSQNADKATAEHLMSEEKLRTAEQLYYFVTTFMHIQMASAHTIHCDTKKVLFMNDSKSIKASFHRFNGSQLY